MSPKGINADERKVEAIRSFKAPSDKEELRSFFGLVTYLGKFIPDVGTLTDPLWQLTRENVTFRLVIVKLLVIWMAVRDIHLICNLSTVGPRRASSSLDNYRLPWKNCQHWHSLIQATSHDL